MKAFLVTLAAVFCLHTGFAQQPTDLTVTLPSGKVVTFQTAEQRDRYLAGLTHARVSAVQQQQQAEQERLAQEQLRREKKEAADVLAKQKLNVFATVLKFTKYGMIVEMRFAMYVPYSREWKDIGPAGGLAYIDRNEVSAVVGQTLLLSLYECGKARWDNDVYRLCTTLSDKAARYYADPKSAKWEGLDYGPVASSTR